ncbi:hypothetical protein [Methylococcus mesophilus]|uniref:hypothetical protein n=1 Tax=Methylococcus mesophilus TaxID=2993564 RepID=UPI00224B02A0|nr:hypothetical protein [Methylococcus mesophilus]UZR27240.1 hypothetical protein OOT43_10880 [Methylococcus mesophilus]
MAGLTVMAGFAAPLGTANATAVCYASEMFPQERIVIDVERQGGLVNPWFDLIALAFGGKQTAYSAHGKHVFALSAAEQTEAAAAAADNWTVATAAATGTVDVSAPSLLAPPARGMRPTDSGAHMGLKALWVNMFDNQETSYPVNLNCGSVEVNPTPNTWRCNVSNEAGFSWKDVYYYKVNIADDVKCNMFQPMNQDNIRFDRTRGSMRGLP